MKILKKITLIFVIIFTSCVSKKRIIYFQKDGISNAIRNPNKFKSDDLLEINIFSPDPEIVSSFNLNNGEKSAKYLIDEEGYINFPVLGKLKIGGLTRKEAIDTFKSKLSPDYIKKPDISIRITNFSFTILGAVKNPNTFTIPNQNITILKAIGMAGDLNISGVRNIKVYREVEGKQKVYKLDLTSNNIFSSPAYYLEQNDVVYVEPNKASYQDASKNSNTGLLISLTSILISIVTFISRI